MRKVQTLFTLSVLATELCPLSFPLTLLLFILAGELNLAIPYFNIQFPNKEKDFRHQVLKLCGYLFKLLDLEKNTCVVMQSGNVI